jgi:hypothetical protein
LIDDGFAGGFIPGVRNLLFSHWRRAAGFSSSGWLVPRLLPGGSGFLGLDVMFCQQISSPERLSTARRMGRGVFRTL